MWHIPLVTVHTDVRPQDVFFCRTARKWSRSSHKSSARETTRSLSSVLLRVLLGKIPNQNRESSPGLGFCHKSLPTLSWRTQKTNVRPVQVTSTDECGQTLLLFFLKMNMNAAVAVVSLELRGTLWNTRPKKCFHIVPNCLAVFSVDLQRQCGLEL